MRSITLNLRDAPTEMPSVYDPIVMAVLYETGRVTINTDIGYSVEHQMRYTPTCKIAWIPLYEFQSAMFKEGTDEG